MIKKNFYAMLMAMLFTAPAVFAQEDSAVQEAYTDDKNATQTERDNTTAQEEGSAVQEAYTDEGNATHTKNDNTANQEHKSNVPEAYEQ